MLPGIEDDVLVADVVDDVLVADVDDAVIAAVVTFIVDGGFVLTPGKGHLLDSRAMQPFEKEKHIMKQKCFGSKTNLSFQRDNSRFF